LLQCLFVLFSQAQHNDDNLSSGPANTTTIIVGILVPIILIGIAGLIFYIWYRKKYPVRMGMGRNFTTFTNPAYSKRGGTVTLAANEAPDLYRTLSRRDPSPMSKDVDEADGVDNPTFNHEEPDSRTDGDDQNAEFSIQDEIEGEIVADLKDEKRGVLLKDIARRGPKKRATLIRTDLEDAELEKSFEFVTESDLGQRSESEISIGNMSTDTHTVSISYNDSPLRLVRSKSENVLTDNENQSFDRPGPGMKTRSQSDSAGNFVQATNEQEKRRKMTIESMRGETIDEDGTDSLDEFEKLEDEISDHKGELHETSSENDNPALCDAVLAKSVDHLPDGKSQSVDKLNFETTEASEIIEKEVPHSEDESGINGGNVHTDDDDQEADRPTGDYNNECLEEQSPNRLNKKRLSLTLLSEAIVFDQAPPTVLLQDSIIFETETPNPIHLDSSSMLVPRRGRRAYTLNDIIERRLIDAVTIQDNGEKSKSSPEIHLDSVSPLVDRKMLSIESSELDQQMGNSDEHLQTMDLDEANGDETHQNNAELEKLNENQEDFKKQVLQTHTSSHLNYVNNACDNEDASLEDQMQVYNTFNNKAIHVHQEPANETFSSVHGLEKAENSKEAALNTLEEMDSLNVEEINKLDESVVEAMQTKQSSNEYERSSSSSSSSSSDIEDSLKIDGTDTQEKVVISATQFNFEENVGSDSSVRSSVSSDDDDELPSLNANDNPGYRFELARKSHNAEDTPKSEIDMVLNEFTTSDSECDA